MFSMRSVSEQICERKKKHTERERKDHVIGKAIELIVFEQMLEDDEQLMFTRQTSFTEKSKERLEIYRRRSLQQNSDDGKHNKRERKKTTHLSSHCTWIFNMSMKVKKLGKVREERDNHFLSIQIRYNILLTDLTLVSLIVYKIKGIHAHTSSSYISIDRERERRRTQVAHLPFFFLSFFSLLCSSSYNMYVDVPSSI